MPYRYRHQNVTTSPSTVFECDLTCNRCVATSASGNPCRRVTCMWLPCCWQHSRLLLGVHPGPSRVIPGSTGLFASRSFAPGEMIAPYGGDVLTNTEVARRYGTGELSIGPYLLGNVDSACRRYIASASNGAFGQVAARESNVYFRDTMHRLTGVEKGAGSAYKGFVLTRGNLGIKKWSVATRPVRAGDELVADYGVAGYEEAFLRRLRECDGECDTTRYVRKRR